MESEERPAKMRKLDHGEEGGDAVMADSAPVIGEINTEEIPAVVPVEMTIPEGQTQEEKAEGKTSQEERTQEEQTQQTQNGENKPPTNEDGTPKISKNQLKKQRRDEKWAAGLEERKIKRKEKTKARKERRREEYRQIRESGVDESEIQLRPGRGHKHVEGTTVPITVIFDCDFEQLMFDPEMKSLGTQITRCYSDNRKSKYQAHLAISSFGGKMKERFDGILAKQYTNWKGVRFFSEDFVEVAAKSKEWMAGKDGGKIAGAIAEGVDADGEEEGEIVYLSSESENILERLKPNSTYIIGGLVDKNRHKGICYKRAVERGIKTAKLPIGQYLQMKSRQVLVTNHVLEIMLKWMECGDWGKAFMEVLPQRKGAALKEGPDGSAQGDEDPTPEADEKEEGDGDEVEDGAATEDVQQQKTAAETTTTTVPEVAADPMAN